MDESIEFIQSLTWRLKFEIFPEKEYIFKRGRVGNKMFFILHGEVTLLLRYTGPVSSKLDSFILTPEEQQEHLRENGGQRDEDSGEESVGGGGKGRLFQGISHSRNSLPHAPSGGGGGGGGPSSSHYQQDTPKDGPSCGTTRRGTRETSISYTASASPFSRFESSSTAVPHNVRGSYSSKVYPVEMDSFTHLDDEDDMNHNNGPEVSVMSRMYEESYVPPQFEEERERAQERMRKVVLARAMNRHDENAFKNTNCVEEPFLTIGRGSFFGEGVFYNGIRSATARASSMCTLLSLTKEDYMKVFGPYPHLQESLQFVAGKRFDNVVRLTKELQNAEVPIETDQMPPRLERVHSNRSVLSFARQSATALKSPSRSSRVDIPSPLHHHLPGLDSRRGSLVSHGSNSDFTDDGL